MNASMTVLIAGGVGKTTEEIVRFFGNKGANLLLADKDKVGLDRLKASSQNEKFQIQTFSIDLSEETQVKNLNKKLQVQNLHINLLVHAIGLETLQREDTHSGETTTILKGTRNSFVHLTEFIKNGLIVTIIPYPEVSENPEADRYSSLKTGLTSLSSAWMWELKEKNARTVSLIPGFFEEIHSLPQKIHPSLSGKIPSGRLGKLSELVQIIYFLSLPDNTYLNGICLPVDGGYFNG